MTPDHADINIHRFIVHKVDHKNATAPSLSDFESPLTDEAVGFLRTTIAANREHKRVRIARFCQPPPNGECLRNLCGTLLANPDAFVADSQEIATRLFDSMRGNNTISSGDLIVCTFSERTSPDQEWLALLKMDPQEAFVGEPERLRGGVRIVLRRVPDVLPTGELQKYAFILPSSLAHSKGYDLLVLDLQAARYGMRRPVASFFLTEFLQAEIGYRSPEMTKGFVMWSRDWVARKAGIWPDEDIDRFNQAVIDALQRHVLDAAEFAESVISEAADRDEYVQHLRKKGLAELTFEVDPGEKDHWTQFAFFRGDDGLQLTIRSAALTDPATYSVSEDPATNTRTVIIKTAMWQRVLRRQ